MTDPLDPWQERLAGHFAALAGQRATSSRRGALFALEHGLDSADRDALSKAIQQQTSLGTFSLEHHLPWVVYAAEIGYQYDGEEYWQTFERLTPHWYPVGDRHFIRSCFRRFQAAFGAATPTGAWASHFTIICWPITHAILPHDLQAQLARHLYDLRHSFHSGLFESPDILGEFVAAKSWNSSARFHNFVQDVALVGQISAALLLEGREGTDTLVHPKTLARIGADLERERNAREWLGGARRKAQDRSSLRVVGPRKGLSGFQGGVTETRGELRTLGITPRLTLRPKSVDMSSWQVLLEIPDLSELLGRFPETQDVLSGSRCTVAGSDGRPLARGSCLYGTQSVKLSRWPRAQEVLLQFDQRNILLDNFLRTECLLRPGPRWLFKIASDGLAHELHNARVRPGGRYIVVAAAGSLPVNNHLRPIDLGCNEADGAILEVAAGVTDEWKKTIAQLSLAYSHSLETWPAGLDAIASDDEGYMEWPEQERPCLAFQSDSAMAALELELQSAPGEVLRLGAQSTSVPFFVELPQLPVGLHEITIRAWKDHSTTAQADLTAKVTIRVREERAPTTGVSSKSPLRVDLEPARPTLEALWEGKVDLAVEGPSGRALKCALSLFNGTATVHSVSEQLPSTLLPVAPAQWRHYFESYVRRNKTVQAGYDEARLCRLSFSADDLGAFDLDFERDFVPMRWSLRRRGGDAIARLLDDRGQLEEPTIRFFPFAEPTKPTTLVFAREFAVAAPGGLYVADVGDASAALIAVPPTLHDFSSLSANPQVPVAVRTVDSAVAALTVSRLWCLAKTSGNELATYQQQQTVKALCGYVGAVLGGDQWAESEEAFSGDPAGKLTLLRDTVSRRPEYRGLAVALAREIDSLAVADLQARTQRLTDLAVSFRVLEGAGTSPLSDNRWMAGLALRLASDPGQALQWAGPHLHHSLKRLLEELPVLTRAARFVVLATDHHLKSDAKLGEFYAGWGWPA